MAQVDARESYRIVSPHRRPSARFELAVRVTEVGVDGEVSASPQAGHTLGPLHGTRRRTGLHRSGSVCVGGVSPTRLGYGGRETGAGSRSAFESLEFWVNSGALGPPVQLNKGMQGLASPAPAPGNPRFTYSTAAPLNIIDRPVYTFTNIHHP